MHLLAGDMHLLAGDMLAACRTHAGSLQETCWQLEGHMLAACKEGANLQIVHHADQQA
jgi:hypothetical protein